MSFHHKGVSEHEAKVIGGHSWKKSQKWWIEKEKKKLIANSQLGPQKSNCEGGN